jgi:hypothetical protein
LEPLQFVPQLFQLQRRVAMAGFPEDIHHFAEHAHAA